MNSRFLVWDSLGGASGDLLLATLLDLGVNLDDLKSALQGIPLPDPYTIEVHPVVEQGMKGLRVNVAVHPVHHAHAHPHRGLEDILKLIDQSTLPPPVCDQIARVFRRLAEAEAAIHAVPVNQVHFHEVGAVDAIVDIAGVCWLLHHLKIDAHRILPLPLGHGVIQCAHGLLPSPAPATLELLKGFRVQSVDEPFELVTPTGAALLTSFPLLTDPPVPHRLIRSGYGFGHRTLNSRPNLLRASLYEVSAADLSAPSECLMLECNLDNANPEWIGDVTGQLMEAGALDVFVTAVQMKKQRPGQLLSVLCQFGDEDRLQALIFRETPTLGIRRFPVQRTTLDRQTVQVQTRFGTIGIKCGFWQGTRITASPEYEDCRIQARQHGVPLRQVYEAALRAIPEG
jgi:uncharacterized protein (TIGR00299 family) protein